MSKAFDIVMDDRKKIVEKIIKNIEEGNLIFQKKWNSNALYPQNPVSNVRYLGANRLRLMIKAVDEEYKDPRWITFKQAEKNGWNIKKGEKGTLCEKWIFTKKETEVDENGKEVEKEVKLDKPLVNYFYVFNAEQIENMPELKINDYTKDVINEITQNFIDSSECKIKEIAQNKAFYYPAKDEIILPPREAFKSQEDFLATTFHEMIHSTGHKSRLDRDLSGGFGSEKYAKEELIAELGSVFLQAKLGTKLEGEHFNNHSAYLKSWIKILKNDYNELFRAAVHAEKASERLYERYTEYKKENLKELNSHPLDSFSINFYYTSTEEEKTYKGIQAYKYLEDLIKFDKDYTKTKRELGENPGNRTIFLKINLEGYSYKKERIDFGNNEFGGFEKVSDALEYKLKSYPRDLIECKDFYAKDLGITTEEVEKKAKDIKNKVEKSIEYFKEKEEIYLNEREKNNKNEYWVIEFHEKSSGDKNFKGKILSNELLKEIEELDRCYREEKKISKFYFDHIKNNQVIEHYRIEIGSLYKGQAEEFMYLHQKINEIENKYDEDKIKNTLIPKKKKIKGKEGNER